MYIISNTIKYDILDFCIPGFEALKLSVLQNTFIYYFSEITCILELCGDKK